MTLNDYMTLNASSQESRFQNPRFPWSAGSGKEIC